MNEAEIINLKETISKQDIIFVVCSNGHGRSSFIAKRLSELGYEKVRAIGINRIRQNELLPDELTELKECKIIICANSDVAATLRFLNNGELVAKKIIIDLKMSESDHAIASGYMSEGKTTELKQKSTAQLKELGF